jgi:hypothetical protein
MGARRDLQTILADGPDQSLINPPDSRNERSRFHHVLEVEWIHGT